MMFIREKENRKKKKRRRPHPWGRRQRLGARIRAQWRGPAVLTSHMGGACSEPECSGAESGPCGFGTDEVVEYGVGIAFARDSTVDTEPVDKFTSWSSDLKLLC